MLDLAAAFLNFETWYKLSGHWETVFVYQAAMGTMAAWRTITALTGNTEKLLKYSRRHMLLEVGALTSVYWANR